MSIVRSLCCRPSSRDVQENDSRKPASDQAGGQPEKLGSDTEVSKLPVPPSQFNKHCNDNEASPILDLLRPYLEYEKFLRRSFVQNHEKVDDLANLVPIYTGIDNSTSVPIRNLERQNANKEKFLMRLPQENVREPGSPAVVSSLEAYKRNFEAFTHSVLNGLDWSNVVAAGSSALLPALPIREDVKIRKDPAVEDPLETYYQRTAPSSDIDLFIYELEEHAAIDCIERVEAVIRKNQRLHHGSGLTLRTKNAITFVSPKWPYRHVQIILRLYKSISEILTGFDVDCACVAYNGKQVYSNPRGIAAMATRTNIIDLSRRSPSYENRLYKYRSHLFDAYWEPLDRTKIDETKCTRTSEHPDVKGLARLIFFEEMLKTRGNVYKRKRLLKTIDENGEPTHSGYATLEVPYGERFTATRVHKFIALHSKEPHMFGTIGEVLGREGRPTKRNKGQLGDNISFLTDDPGRQMIGSFHPLSGEDWAETAYQSD